MNNLFPQHYRPSSDELRALFKKCVFVFDANMLLNLYRYPRKAREDLFKILRKISKKGNLWLPFQAALEFQENRLAVISDQKRKFGQVRKVIAEIQVELQKKLDELQLRKRHSSIDPDALIKEINLAFQKYISQLELLDSEQPDITQDDKIRAEIDSLFEGRVGKPFSQPELETIFNDGNARYKIKQPPGYEDEREKKGTYTFHENLVIKREFGDLIVWNEIIRFINEQKPKGIVFVTDDNKEDWWLQLSGKTIGPRPELLSELYAKTGLYDFHVYNSERFVEIASQQFGVKIGQDSLEQIKEIKEETHPGYFARRARELMQLYDGKCQVCGFSDKVEATHIIPRFRGGPTTYGNILILCPNHHRLFDMGYFSISNDYHLLGLNGELTVHPSHELSIESLEYHRERVYKPRRERMVKA